MPLRPLRARHRLIILAGGLCLLVAVLFMAFDPGELVRGLREKAFDSLLAWSPRTEVSNEVVIVDIDREALARFGQWPWPRNMLALLINKISAANPKALAIDILLASKQPDDTDPLDQSLAEAIARVPTVLAMVLDPNFTNDTIPPPALVNGNGINPTDLWNIRGIATPEPLFAAKARGFGVISFWAPEGEPVRTVPLLVYSANSLIAGMAAEALRVATNSISIDAVASQQVLRIADRSIPLPRNGLLRLHFSSKDHRQSRKIPAWALISGDRIPGSQRTGGRRPMEDGCGWLHAIGSNSSRGG
jgi:adenylate cyclase